ncbi:MAG: phenylalanine--tRNA ligase subunit beta [Candidatus Omnitrophica bacterium]|nr:phenylalanine--tRNA ligase subunit beta [Candidatus Omnitrophota bacterium]
MKVSYNWLKDYVDVGVSAEELADRLTMTGSEVETIEKVDGDKILHFEITSNRPDCLNILGMAREAAIVCDKELISPKVEFTKSPVTSIKNEIDCVVKDPDLCSKYTARVIKNVKIKPSGKKISSRLSALGFRLVNNVADVTNYCLMELGQPMHAFDMDKIKGGKIVVRRAKPGEKLVTIDGVERELAGDMLVIADSERAIAVAGVMGGRDTEVTDSTKNILLESAYFNPLSIRHTARKLSLASDSSYRFERGVNKDMVAKASNRAANLIIEEAGGEIGGFYETGVLNIPETKINFSLERCAKILGIEPKQEWVKKVFDKLGAETASKNGKDLEVKPPSFREDLTREIDLVEEVARIYGYNNIPATAPLFKSPDERKDKSRQVTEKLSKELSAAGLYEIMTYNLTDDADAARFPAVKAGNVVLSNYLSEEHKVLVPELLSGMLKSISYNINRQNKDMRFFEIGKVYAASPNGKSYDEIKTLCIGITGLVRNDWKGRENADLFLLKGMIEEALGVLKVEARFKPEKIEDISPSAGIYIGGVKRIGFLGEVSPKVLKALGIDQNVFVCHIQLGEVIKNAVLTNRYRSIPKFPFSSRDVSILCGINISSAEIESIIKKEGEEFIREVKLIDIYQGEKLPEGKRSLTYSITYGVKDRTLLDKEVEDTHTRIKSALSQKLNVTFR